MLTRIFPALLLTVITGSCLIAQSFAGTYVDGLADVTITRLELREDSSFALEQPDPVFTNQFSRFSSTGRWSASGDTVWLNPEATPRKPVVTLTAITSAPVDDTITIDLRYFTEEYAGDSLLGREAYPIEQVTVFAGKRRRGYNLVAQPVFRSCAFAPRVKRQVLPAADGSFHLPLKTGSDRLGILTYGFDEVVWLPAAGRRFDLTIVQPVEVSRTPRRKAVIMKKGRAYFYERNGKVPTGDFSTPLERR